MKGRHVDILYHKIALARFYIFLVPVNIFILFAHIYVYDIYIYIQLVNLGLFHSEVWGSILQLTYVPGSLEGLQQSHNTLKQLLPPEFQLENWDLSHLTKKTSKGKQV